MRTRFATLALATLVLIADAGAACAADATALLKAAFDNWRANSSQSTITMVVHRPSWERHLGMQSWTEGSDKALVRFVSPAQDAGNATLKLSGQTWVFTPKLNQTIKLPESLLAQSWMGSDFSYNDLSKADDIVVDYTHRIVGQNNAGGHVIYSIEAIPKPGAPVVWGKLVAVVRDDGIFLGETYFDQAMQPVRMMDTTRVATLGGRAYPVTMRMRPANGQDEWTVIDTTNAAFDIALPSITFTRSNLENPRD